MAAEMQSSIEISWRFAAFHGFFALKLVQMVGECMVIFLLHIRSGARVSKKDLKSDNWLP